MQLIRFSDFDYREIDDYWLDDPNLKALGIFFDSKGREVWKGLGNNE